MGSVQRLVIGSSLLLVGAVCTFLVVVLVDRGLQQADLWAALVGSLASVVAVLVAIWPQIRLPSKDLVPSPPENPKWVVHRPELSVIIDVLLNDSPVTDAYTIGLHGAGGFGKTTLARAVVSTYRVQERFNGRVYFVTIGADVRDPATIAAKVNGVIRLMGGEAVVSADPAEVGQRLGLLLDLGPRRLLILDDLWDSHQLAPFMIGGRNCVRLVTTRVRSLLDGWDRIVGVGQMSNEQASSLLTQDLPPMDKVAARALVGLTGCCPLVLRLANKILVNAVNVGLGVREACEQLTHEFVESGPGVMDDLLGHDVNRIDTDQPEDRAYAVRATMAASTRRLSESDVQRLTELSVFAADEPIPLHFASCLWSATGELSDLASAQVISRLAEYALIDYENNGADEGGIILHDVIRDYLRAELGPKRIATLNGLLLDAMADDLATAPALGSNSTEERPAWWELRYRGRYLPDHLLRHLHDAGRLSEAEQVACDLRWVASRLQESGPAAPAADLSFAGTPQATRLQAVLARISHLLAPTTPVTAVIDILHSRVAEDSYWGPQVVALRNMRQGPKLVIRWPLPDVPDSALQRVLVGHAGSVLTVAIAPDGTWLASGGSDATVRIWDAATGQERVALTRHDGAVRALAIEPGGGWLATGSADGAVRIWETESWECRSVLPGPDYGVSAVAIAPDGSWLAAGSENGIVRIWNATTAEIRADLMGHDDGLDVSALAFARDGSWLVSTSWDGTARIWDVATGHQRAVLRDRGDSMHDVSLAPDDNWLAIACADGTVQIWDVAMANLRTTLSGHGADVSGVAIAPDGTWLASVNFGFDINVVDEEDNAAVWIWKPDGRTVQASLTGYHGRMETVAIAPNGDWLATGSGDGTVRIWTPTVNDYHGGRLDYEGAVPALAIASDRAWIATCNRGTVRILDAATGHERTALTLCSGWADDVAIVPDGGRLVSVTDDERDGIATIWNTATRQELIVITGRQITTVAIASDGTWLATGGRDGMVRAWDAFTGREIATLSGHEDAVSAMAIAYDGSFIVSGSYDKTVRIWDTAGWRERVRLDGLDTPVCAVAIAPDDSWLASGGYDRVVRIYDIATAREQAILDGHSSCVSAVSIAPDGKWIASAGDDKTARIWDTTLWQAQAMMRAEARLVACAWTADGGLIVGGLAGLYGFDFLAR
jgi:WD40 repeat protein